jgi:sugar lactone lactonase YvrE
MKHAWIRLGLSSTLAATVVSCAAFGDIKLGSAAGGSAGAGGTNPCPGATSQPVVLASQQVNPVSVAVEGASVYWTDYANGAGDAGTVMKVSANGGTPTVLAAGQYAPKGIAVDETSVYWTNELGGTVMKVSMAGGTAITLAPGQQSPQGIAVDKTRVFWADSAPNTVMDVPVDGGSDASQFAYNQSHVLSITSDPGKTHVYWMCQGDSTRAGAIVGALGADSASTSQLVPDAGYLLSDGITADATNVYWMSGGMIMSLSINGGTPTPLTPAPSAYPTGTVVLSGIVSDGSNVYWTNQAEGTVMKVSVNGGTPTPIACMQAAPNGIAVDGTSVYWANSGDGTIMKAAK